MRLTERLKSGKRGEDGETLVEKIVRPPHKPQGKQRVLDNVNTDREVISFTPHTVAAGVVPAVGADPVTTAYHAAAQEISTEAVCMVYTRQGKKVWWIATPSWDVPYGKVRTPLAQALPGHPSHQGDKGYVAETDSGIAAVAKVGEKLIVHIGDEYTVQNFCEQLDIEAVRTSNRTPSDEDLRFDLWENYHLAEQARTQKALAQTLNWGMAFAAVCAAAWVGLASLTASQKAGHADYLLAWEKHAQEVRSDLQGLGRNPAMRRMSALNDVLVFAEETDGVIRKYKIDAKKGEGKAVIRVPLWTLPQKISEFGSEGQIFVEKTDEYRTVTKTWEVR